MMFSLAILAIANIEFPGVEAAASALGYDMCVAKSRRSITVTIGGKRPGLKILMENHENRENPQAMVDLAVSQMQIILPPKTEISDGLPIGDSYAAYPSDHPIVFAAIPTVLVSSGIGNGGTREELKGPFSPSLVEPEGYLARWALGETVGMQCAATAPSKINGVSLDCAKSSAYGITMGSLGDWGRARSWSASKNVGHGTCYLTKGTKAILLVMGSSQVKVNGKWVTAKQPTMFFNDDWYADLSVLESAAN
ncbi:MAG: hypothetical protein JST40_01230 [Armatimonadetes bacterium]|nr:hypothetical protein [Armatimonadota bacterium]